MSDREGTILIHPDGKCVGVRVGARVFTHNMVLSAIGAASWVETRREDVPEKLRGFLKAAERQARTEEP